MKTLILVISFFSVQALALGTYHKTESGKYPHYYVEEPTDTPWNDKDQAEYDTAIDAAIEQLCFKTAQVKKLQSEIDEEKAVGKSSGYVNAKVIHDATVGLLKLKKEIEPTAKTIKDETGKAASEYECVNGSDDE